MSINYCHSDFISFKFYHLIQSNYLSYFLYSFNCFIMSFCKDFNDNHHKLQNYYFILRNLQGQNIFIGNS